MPNLIVEYSANLDAELDISQLLQHLHQCARQQAALPTGGIRTRAARRDHFVIADGHPDNSFVYLTLRIAKGRTPQVQQALGDALFGSLCNFVKPVYDKRALSLAMEIQEIEPTKRWKQSNIREHMSTRSDQVRGEST